MCHLVLAEHSQADVSLIFLFIHSCFSAERRLIFVSIQTYTWQSWANASLCHSFFSREHIHSIRRMLATKCCTILLAFGRWSEATQDSQIDRWPDSFEKYRDTPPIFIAILLQKYALFVAESSMYTANLYHDMAPICISILFQEY